MVFGGFLMLAAFLTFCLAMAPFAFNGFLLLALVNLAEVFDTVLALAALALGLGLVACILALVISYFLLSSVANTFHGPFCLSLMRFHSSAPNVTTNRYKLPILDLRASLTTDDGASTHCNYPFIENK